ncbi:VWA domain-containing protein [Chthonobacter albigriseus]|uniref:VWA domain-containing protein n=1 Tax=Chthonobacter albigriseus TaxID=1683161 RepID=UPI0015EE49D4|nr:VWA domain-containing protein [Chthonobacter albigriseus]
MLEWLATPLALLLAPLPFLVRRLVPPSPAAAGALTVPPAIAARLTEGEGLAARQQRRFLLLAWVAWLFLVVALAGPQRILPAQALPASAHEIVLVLDLSGSMESKDMTLGGETVRRVDAVKSVARDFVQRRAGDRIGVVFFAEESQVASVPTFDVEAVDAVLANADIGDLGRSTAIGDGLGLALKRLKDSATPNRVVVLLSDGTSTAGAVRPEAAAALARELGVRVHTIALGTNERLEQGQSGVASLVDAQTLEAIAAASGGRFFRVRDTDDLRAVTAEIDRAEGGRMPAPPASVAQPLWPWPAGASFALLLVLAVLERRRP